MSRSGATRTSPRPTRSAGESRCQRASGPGDSSRSGSPYIGYTADDIRTVFFDHALIASLGCASVLNLPVVHDGRTLGVLNLLHEASWYGEDDVPLGQVFAALAVPAFGLLSG